MLRTILDELMKDLPDPQVIIANMQKARRFELPPTYREKVQSCLSVLLYIVKENKEPHTIFFDVFHAGDLDYLTKKIVDALFSPLFKYIDEQIKNVNSFQYLLIRFKAKSEWFDQSTLYNRYIENTGIGESTLDCALREYLFDQGISFPFSKPSSPSGEVDVLSLIENKPVPLEIKVFDGLRKSQNHIRQGLRQAISYAKDYGEPSAYLVIFNVSENEIVFKLSQKEVPQRVNLGDKTIFIFVVNLFPHEKTASKRDLKTVSIEETYLLESTEKA